MWRHAHDLDEQSIRNDLSQRKLGRITRRGDGYLRLLLIHGARAALRAARIRQQRHLPLTRGQSWALATQQRVGQGRRGACQQSRVMAVDDGTSRYRVRHESCQRATRSTNQPTISLTRVARRSSSSWRMNQADNFSGHKGRFERLAFDSRIP